MLNQVAPLPLKDPTLFRQANYLDGKWVEADGGQTMVVKNPATGEAVGEVPNMGTAETRRAIEAAAAAYPGWRAMLAKERAAILRKLSDLMLANADDLAVMMTAEQGKPLAEAVAKSSMPRALSIGSRMRRSGFMAIRSRRMPRGAGSWY